MGLAIAQATTADLDALLALMRDMQVADPWSEPFSEAEVRKNLRDLILSPIFGVAYLARDGELPIAYLVVCFDFSLEYRGKGAWIDELFVIPSRRGLGLGTRLLELAQDASRELGAHYLHLEVSHGNRAIELYRRNGFVDHHRYLMTKLLDSKPSANPNSE